MWKGTGRGWWLAGVAVVLAHASGSSAQAALTQSYGEPTTPRAMGMADAVAGSAMSTSAVFSNPAGIAFGQVFHAEAFYGYTDDVARHIAGIATADSTSVVAGGLGFTYTYTGIENEQNNQYDFRTSVAMLFADVFSLGVNLKWIRVDYTEGLTGVDALNDFSLDAGAMFKMDIFYLGVTGTNLTNLDHPMAPLTLSVGGGLSLGPANLEFDASFDWSTYDEEEPMGMRFAGGGEILIAESYVIRAGYRYEDIPDTHLVAAGVGYVNPELAVDVGFQQDVWGERSDTRFGLSFRYFIQ